MKWLWRATFVVVAECLTLHSLTPESLDANDVPYEAAEKKAIITFRDDSHPEDMEKYFGKTSLDP